MNSSRRDLGALAADLLAVLVFAAVGRRAHGEAPGALLVTFWPFGAGVVVGHLAARLVRRPRTSLIGGAVVVASTVVVGMVLRVVTGAGTAPAFVLVAVVVLSVFLLGWRAVARWVGARRVGARPGSR